jgi:hypoxanthine phosphoribosyltransferase
VEVVRDVGDTIEDRTVLLVDDILESGRTLAFAKQNLLERGASEVRLCVLLDKPHKRVAGIEADFVGFGCPDRFVVGYGLDYAHYHRELPFIGVIEGE